VSPPQKDSPAAGKGEGGSALVRPFCSACCGRGTHRSLVGEEALPPEGAGSALVDFCATFAPALTTLIETRLVQTNVVKRALALRFGLAAIGRRVAAPVHLIEVGASAGILLRHDRYGYRLGDRRFGDPQSPVQIVSE